jgi:hypothetical protein
MGIRDGDEGHAEPEPHRAARPMKVVVADDGCTWLCDADVDEDGDLGKQGCWRCGDLPFTRDD